MFLFLCCKDTTKSNNRQIFKGKSYCIVYYLTFINIKIKDYYIITYFLCYLCYCTLYHYIIYIYIIIYKERTKARRREGRENQGEGCRRHLRQFLASLLLRLMSIPSTPSPAAHHFSRLCQRSGRETGGHIVRFWAMLSPPHRHTSPPIDQQQGSASTVCHPARLVLVLFLHVVR